MAYHTTHYVVDRNGYKGTSVLIVRTGDRDESIPEPERRIDRDHIVKILLIGDSGVGKSCLLSRFADDSFTEEFAPTIGVDFRTRTINLDGKIIKIQMWDTPGQERFPSITKCYYTGAHGVVVVYDVTDLKSFNDVGMWLEQIDAYGQEGISRLLIGTKCDLIAQREVDFAKAKEFADTHQMPLVETSAKNSTNVDRAFVQLVIGIKKYITDNTIEDEPPTELKQMLQTKELNPRTRNTKNTRSCVVL